MASASTLDTISPFFIVDNLVDSVDFYNQKLGFLTDALIPNDEPFFAIMRRDGVSILLKEIAPEIHPIPNHTRHAWARWDALVIAPDPDALFRVRVPWGGASQGS